MFCKRFLFGVRGECSMSVFKFYRSRKYLLRMLLTISVFIISLLFLAIFTISYTYENKLLKAQHEANKRVLHQVMFNINSMQQMVLNLTMSTYFDNQVKALRYADSIESYDLYPILMRLEKIVYSNPFLHSLVVYNANTGCYYSTEYTMNCEEDGMNQAIDQYLINQSEISKLQLVPMSYDGPVGNGNSADFFSFYMYDSDSFSKDNKSMLIVNINPEWLFDNINNLNKMMDYEDSQILILDKDENMINASIQGLDQENNLINQIRMEISSSNKTSDYLIDEIDQEKKIISYMYSPEQEWSIVNVQHYDAVVGQIKDIRLVMIYILGSLLGCAIIGSFFVAHRLYKPVANVIQQIKDKHIHSDILEVNDEMKVISNEFQRSLNYMKEMKENENFNKQIINNYYLRKLIVDSSLSSLDEFKDKKQLIDLGIDLNQPLLLAIIKIDAFEEYNHCFNNEEKRIIEFAIGNIIQETMGQTFPNEWTKMRKDHFVLLLNNHQDLQATQQLKDLFKQVQFTFREQYDLSLSITISSPIFIYSEITHIYLQTLGLSMYRLVYGHQSLITPEMVERNEQNVEFYYPEKIEKNLVEGLKSNQLKLIKEQLIGIFEYITTLSYNNMMYAIMHTFVLIEKTVREINQHHVFQFEINLREYYDQLSSMETLEDVFRMLHELTEQLCEKRNKVREDDKHDLLVETVKEIIEDSYTDINLSLQGIASDIGVSTAYLSKVFRSQESVSIADYIKDVRLTHGAKMLEENKYTVNKIIELTGFGNQSYFYKLFKKKYGATPKEYQQSKILNQ